MNKNTEQINIYKENLLPWMVEVVHNQYGLQEPDYEKYLDNLCNNDTKFIDLSSEHTLQLFKDFVNILPDLQEIVYEINDSGTNPTVTNMVMDGMVDSEHEKLLQLDNSINKILENCTQEQKIEYLQIIINNLSDNT